MSYSMIITTIDDKNLATSIAKELIQLKLAGCIAIEPITSFYNWNKEVACDEEYRISIKTSSSNIDDIYNFLLARHSYDLMQFIVLPISTSTEYGKWLESPK